MTAREAGRLQACKDADRALAGTLGRIGSSMKSRSPADLLDAHASYHDRMAKLQDCDAYCPTEASEYSRGHAEGLRAEARKIRARTLF